MNRRALAAIIAGVVLACAAAHGQQGTVKAGAGSYRTSLPRGAREPQATIYKTADLHGPIPTSDWWSSLAWEPFSEPMYAHPLTLQVSPAGMKIHYPGPDIKANRVGIFGEMSSTGDLVLGHSAQPVFPDARLHAFSDWFVTASFSSGNAEMRVSFGHGSPFVYALYTGGNPTVTFASAPKIWAGDNKSPVLGITINRRHYALFGPSGATWQTTDRVFSCNLHGKAYFSLALLPDNSPATLEKFRRFAYAHVTDTRAVYSYQEKTASVVTRFQYTTHAYEGTETDTLFALYPHQAAHLTGGPSRSAVPAYASICGAMPLGEGKEFATRMIFPGVLPALPDVESSDKTRLRRFVREEADTPAAPFKDTYWEGKLLGQMASVIPIAEQCGEKSAAAKLTSALKNRLENWFQAANSGAEKDRTLFYYNALWGTLIGYPASYGSDNDLSDHHFHYGFFLRAAAEVARHDPDWASDAKWGAMIRMLQRDTASGDRNDRMFPYLRNFDPYAGHSWASGTAKFVSGNNEESSSEAMNAWTGLILLGEALHDTALRDLGIYLYTTEMEGINAYWFDVTGRNHPDGYTPSVVTMVWGGKRVNETWFSAKPEDVHGINWTPFHGGSLYLGLYPEYVRKNYAALKQEKGSENWEDWADLIWMYHALSDPEDALRQFNAHPDYTPEAGNAKANTLHWIEALRYLGQPERSITADAPLYSVFRKGGVTHYVVYNMQPAPRKVTFSDGFALVAQGRQFTVKQR